jgi:hypothetical protein
MGRSVYLVAVTPRTTRPVLRSVSLFTDMSPTPRGAMVIVGVGARHPRDGRHRSWSHHRIRDSPL